MDCILPRGRTGEKLGGGAARGVEKWRRAAGGGKMGQNKERKMSSGPERFIALLSGPATDAAFEEAQKLLEENPQIVKGEIRLGGPEGAPAPVWFPLLLGAESEKWGEWVKRQGCAWRVPQGKSLGRSEYPLEHIAAYCCSRPLEEALPKLRAYCAVTSRPWWMLGSVVERSLEDGRAAEWAQAAIGLFGDKLEDGAAFFGALDRVCKEQKDSHGEEALGAFVSSWIGALGEAMGPQWTKQVFGWCFTDTEDSDWECWEPCQQALLETDPKVMAWCMEGLLKAGADAREPDEFGDRPMRRLAIASRKKARIGQVQSMAYRALKAAGARPEDVLSATTVEAMFAGLEMGSLALSDWEASNLTKELDGQASQGDSGAAKAGRRPSI